MKGRLERLIVEGLTNGGSALSVAAVVDGVLALAFTLVSARILGPGGYGSLAALVSIFLIGSLVGSGLQMAVARRIASEQPRPTWRIRESAAYWVNGFSIAAVMALIACALARDGLADEIGIQERWAAALIVPVALLDVAVGIQRGLLLGWGAYRLAAISALVIPAGWLVIGVGLAMTGMGLTGIVVGIGVTEVCAVVLLQTLVRRLPKDDLRTPRLSLKLLVREGWGPMAALGVFALLQNLDVIAVRRSIADDAIASAYAAAAVGGKAILWLAIGVGQYLLAEAAKDGSGGVRGRQILVCSAGLVLSTGILMASVFFAAGEPLLSFVFGPDFTEGANVLPLLAIAMTLLAIAYLCLQVLIAHHNHSLFPVLAVAAILQPVVIVLTAPNLQHIALGIISINLAITILLGLAVFRSPIRLSPSS